MALQFGALGAARPPGFVAPSQMVSQGMFNANPFEWHPPGKGLPGQGGQGGGGGQQGGGVQGPNLAGIGHHFLNIHSFNDPPWMKAFRAAFFQADPGADRRRAVTQFLSGHDPFVGQYQGLIERLRKFGILIPDSGGGGAIGAGGSYYLRPLYGLNEVQNPLTPPPPPPPPRY